MVLRTQKTIKASAEKVWEALTDPKIVKQYFYGTDMKTTWKVGEPITFTGEWEGNAYTDKGTVLTFEPHSTIEYKYLSSFSGKEDKPENYATIGYYLKTKGGSTVLTISQNMIDTKERMAESRAGWQMLMNAIAGLVE